MNQARRCQRPELKSLLATLLLTASLAAHATAVPSQDAKGLQDPPGLPRFTGSALFINESVDYDEIKAPAAAVKASDGVLSAAKYAEASGRRWRMMYRIPDGRSPLEVVRNYQQQLKAKGYTALYECSGEACGDETAIYYTPSADTFFSLLYPRAEFTRWQDSDPASCAGGWYVTDMRYAVMKQDKTGELVALVTHRPGIVSAHCPEEEWKKHLFATVVHVKPKAMEANMETLEASAMAKAINDTGKVAIYGILFDTASATIKPESKPSLDQIAALLKKDAGLSLHIVGHTDSQGKLDANFDLSKRRAEAVKAALVKDYGISASRLTANGVASLAPVAPNTTDEGRAKNRRVELVPS